MAQINSFFISLLFLLSVTAPITLQTTSQCSSLLLRTKQALKNSYSKTPNTIEIETNILETLPQTLSQAVSTCLGPQYQAKFLEYMPKQCMHGLIHLTDVGVSLLGEEEGIFGLSKQMIGLPLTLIKVKRNCPFAENITVSQIVSLKDCIKPLLNFASFTKSKYHTLNSGNMVQHFKSVMEELDHVTDSCGTDTNTNMQWMKSIARGIMASVGGSCGRAIVGTLVGVGGGWGEGSLESRVEKIKKECILAEAITHQ